MKIQINDKRLYDTSHLDSTLTHLDSIQICPDSIPSRFNLIIAINTHDIDLCTVKVLRMRHRSIGEVVRAPVSRYDVVTTV